VLHWCRALQSFWTEIWSVFFIVTYTQGFFIVSV
jgi:hypothetical protein